jgi:hypothetical protein
MTISKITTPYSQLLPIRNLLIFVWKGILMQHVTHFFLSFTLFFDLVMVKITTFAIENKNQHLP